MNYKMYADNINKLKTNQKKLSQSEYDKQFSLNKRQLKGLDVKGIAIDPKNQKLLLAKDRKANRNLLIYGNPKNKFYYLSSGNSDKNTINSLFGKLAKYEIIENNLFIYNEKNKSLTKFDQLENFYNKQENLDFTTPIEKDRKYRLTDLNKVDTSAKEKLALSLGLSSNAFNNNEIKVNDVDVIDNNKALLTIDNPKSNKEEHFISNFKDDFINKLQISLKTNPSVKLGFEELKNASSQIAMGFLEFYGAEFNEDTLERDPKIIVDEKGYNVSKIDRQGNRNDISTKTNLESAIFEAKQSSNIEKDTFRELEQVQQSKGSGDYA